MAVSSTMAASSSRRGAGDARHGIEKGAVAETLQRPSSSVDASRRAVEDLQATVKSARRDRRAGGEGQGLASRAAVRGAGGAAPAQRPARRRPRDARAHAERRQRGRRCSSPRRAARSARALLDGDGGAHARGGEGQGPGWHRRAGLLPTLLFDPQYKPVAEDVRVGGPELPRRLGAAGPRPGACSGAAQRRRATAPMGEAAADFRAAMANLRVITDRLKAGEGTWAASSRTRRCTRTSPPSSRAPSGAICCGR